MGNTEDNFRSGTQKWTGCQQDYKTSCVFFKSKGQVSIKQS